jgi:hypothetical protein
MTGETRSKAVPALALTKTEAARSLGMSVRSFDKYVMPDVKIIRRGSMVLISVRELERWADESAERTLA